MGSVSDNPVVQQQLNNVEEVHPKTNNETSSITIVHPSPHIAARQPIALLKRVWTDYIQPGSLADQAVDEEIAGETNNQTSSITNVYRFMVLAAKRLTQSLCGMWTRYFPRGTLGEASVMKPRSAYKLVIFGLLSFAAIKSQGGAAFHPRITMVSVTSLLMFGLACYVISAAPPVYAVIARLVGKLCLFILVGSLASLFYL